MNAVSTTGGPDGGWVSLHIAKGIPERLSLCYPLTIKTNPGKSALQVREHSKNKIAHRRFCTFRTSSCHACPRSTGSTRPPHPLQALSLRAFTFNCRSKIPTRSELSTSLRRPRLSDISTAPPLSRRSFHLSSHLSLFTVVHPLSLQPLTKCSSRNSFVFKTIHFDGGVCTPPPTRKS